MSVILSKFIAYALSLSPLSDLQLNKCNLISIDMRLDEKQSQCLWGALRVCVCVFVFLSILCVCACLYTHICVCVMRMCVYTDVYMCMYAYLLTYCNCTIQFTSSPETSRARIRTDKHICPNADVSARICTGCTE